MQWWVLQLYMGGKGMLGWSSNNPGCRWGDGRCIEGRGGRVAVQDAVVGVAAVKRRGEGGCST